MLRLGSIFEIAHRSYTQSESEQSHFTINDTDGNLKESELKFLREATKWSVLFEQPETKKKNKFQPESVEYVLNPIYSPYFHISYRKKKSINFTTKQIKCLISGDLSEYQVLVKQFNQSFLTEKTSIQQSLFTFIEGDNVE